MEDLLKQRDFLRPDEFKMVGLKQTYSDTEREQKMKELVGNLVEVRPEPGGLDPYCLACYHDGELIGWVAYEQYDRVCQYLNEGGSTVCKVVRLGRHTCLIVRFPSDTTGYDKKHPRRTFDYDAGIDTDRLISPDERLTMDAYRALHALGPTLDYTLKHPMLIATEEWQQLIGKVTHHTQTFVGHYHASPSYDVRKALCDVIDMVGSLAENSYERFVAEPAMQQLVALLAKLLELERCYLGDGCTRVFVEHFLWFMQRCQNSGDDATFEVRMRREAGNGWTGEFLDAQRLALHAQIQEVDEEGLRAVLDLSESSICRYLTYCRMDLKQLYGYYSYLHRLSLLKSWKKLVEETGVAACADFRPHRPQLDISLVEKDRIEDLRSHLLKLEKYVVPAFADRFKSLIDNALSELQVLAWLLYTQKSQYKKINQSRVFLVARMLLRLKVLTPGVTDAQLIKTLDFEDKNDNARKNANKPARGSDQVLKIMEHLCCNLARK